MHVLIANLTIDPERHQALAMSYGEMFEMRKTLDARIHNNLARKLSAVGYTVEVAEHGFRLREIPAMIEEIYSVRSKEITTAKELLKEGYTVRQLGDALRDRPVKEKSELWVSAKIRELLGVPELPADRRIDEHDLNEQAWLVTRRRDCHDLRIASECRNDPPGQRIREVCRATRTPGASYCD